MMYIQVSGTKAISFTEKGYFIPPMALFLKAIGVMVRKILEAVLFIPMALSMKEIGSAIYLMVRDGTRPWMVNDMTEAGNLEYTQDMGLSTGRMGQSSKGHMKMECEMGMDS